MLRNCSVPFLAGSVVALVEAATGHDIAASAVTSVLFAAAALSVLRSGRRLRVWANEKTLQICYWIPQIDDAVRGGNVAPKQGQRSPKVMRRRREYEREQP
jgi:hypothetical protein